MLRAVARCCGHWPPGAAAADGMLWQTELRPHAAGEFSMAAAQANLAMEDQAQVLASPAATLVGIYDGHGGADASRFLRSRLFPHVQRAFDCCLLVSAFSFLGFDRSSLILRVSCGRLRGGAGGHERGGDSERVRRGRGGVP